MPDSNGTIKLKPEEKLVGKTILHYQILKMLGSGGMGTVYQAKDTKLNRFVAIKFLKPHLSQEENQKKRFIHEAQATSAFDHPNICSIYEINETEDGQMFIVMAYYDGETLKQKMDKGPMDADEAIEIAMQIAQGLRKAHSKDIIHRDIKPANVIITADGEVKIVDFGLAKLAGITALTQEGTTLGTVSYMSPEQASGGEVDQRTDIWALGVLLYEMLSGKRPFRGDYPQAVIYSIMNEDPEPLTDLCQDIPASLCQMVSRALEKTLEKRYHQVKEILKDLHSISVGMVPDDIKTRVSKAKLHKRRKSILYGVSSAFIIIMAILAISVFTGHAKAIDSLAVLPLKNLTGDSGQEFFVDGITDELIGQLGQISGLRRVISRTSVMRYKQTEKSLPEIARELKVAAIVEGSVKIIGDTVRIQVRLIDPLNQEENLWGKTFEHAKKDVLMIYNEVAAAIANKIKVKLTEAERASFARARQVNPGAYEAYLKGMSHWYRLNPQDLETALSYFESALEKDPNYALAYTGIALVWIGRNQEGLVLPREAVPKEKEAALKAMELDDTLPEVHYVKALIKTWTDCDWEGGEAAFQRALELKPNYPDAMVFYSNLLCYMGRPQAALVQGEQALKLDPYNALLRGIYGLSLLMARRYDDALLQANEALKITPTDLPSYCILWEVMHMKGMHKEALKAAKKFYAGLGLGSVAELMEQEYKKNGYSDAMKLAGNAFVELSRKTHISPFLISYPFVFARNIDKALEWLEKGYQIGDPNMPYMIEPCFVDLLKDEPRYQDLLRKMNLPLPQ